MVQNKPNNAWFWLLLEAVVIFFLVLSLIDRARVASVLIVFLMILFYFLYRTDKEAKHG